MFCKKVVLTNFTKLTGKHLHLAWPATLLKNSCAGVSFELCETSKNTFFIEHLWWLLFIEYPWWLLLKSWNTPLMTFYFVPLTLFCIGKYRWGEGEGVSGPLFFSKRFINSSSKTFDFSLDTSVTGNTYTNFGFIKLVDTGRNTHNFFSVSRFLVKLAI